jgi:hypothetical protein
MKITTRPVVHLLAVFLASTLTPTTLVSAAGSNSAAARVNHVESSRKYRQTADEMFKLLPADRQLNVNQRMTGYIESESRNLESAISGNLPRRLQSHRESTRYQVAQVEKAAAEQHEKVQELMRRVHQATTSRNPNADNYRNQLLSAVGDLTVSLRRLALYHETFNRLDAESEKQRAPQTGGRNDGTQIATSNRPAMGTPPAVLSPCNGRTGKPAPVGTLSIDGAGAGMTKADLLRSVCAEAGGKVMLMEPSASVSFQHAFRGNGIPAESRVKSLLGTFRNKREASATVERLTTALNEPVEALRLCIGCEPERNGRPRGGADLANGLTVRFLEDGRAAGLMRTHKFREKPTTVAQFLAPMVERWGSPSYQFAQRERITVGWVFPTGNQPLPKEDWYVRQTGNGKTTTELNRDGLLDQGSHADMRMRLVALKPRATYCIGWHFGTGPFVARVSGQPLHRAFGYADDWQHWDTYLFERANGKTSPKRTQPVVEKYVPPGHTRQCGVVVLAKLNLSQMPKVEGSTARRVDLGSVEPLDNATIELLDTRRLNNNFDVLERGRIELESFERGQLGIAPPLTLAEARKAAALTATPAEAQRRYDARNGEDMNAWKACLYRDKSIADAQDRARCQPLDPLGRPASQPVAP